MIALERFAAARILVLGDFIIDHYVEGVVDRISPEAPVPVLKKVHESFRLGGAANVAVNCRALGAETHLLSMTGPSPHAYDLEDLLAEQGLDDAYICIHPNVRPIIKTRFTSDGHHMLRLDDEQIMELSSDWVEDILDRFCTLLPLVDVVVFSDYAKGFFHPQLLERTLHLARVAGKRVLVDPKGVSYAKYKDCYLIKPNQKEAYKAANLDPVHHTLSQVAEKLLAQVEPTYLLITRSKEGMELFDQSGQAQHYPTRKKEVVDVVGAGDTALALLAVALGSDHSIGDAVAVANIGSSIVVSKPGCASVTVAELLPYVVQFQ